MTVRITTIVVMTTTTTMTIMMTMMTAVAALAMLSMKATMMITAKKGKEVTFFVLPNLVQHAGLGKDATFITDSFKR